MRKLYLLFIVLFAALLTVSAQEKQAIRVACVGNSITYGAGIKNRFQDSYPGVLQQLLGKEYDVRNFGFSGRTLLNKGDYPYMHEQLFVDAQKFLPNIVTIKLGTNDSKPWNWVHKKDFKKDLRKMIDTFKDLPTHPTIYLCLPVPAVATTWGINDSTITHDIIPYILQVAKEKKIKTIDLYKALLPYPQDFPDKIHPNEHGSMLIANEIYRTFTGKEPAPLISGNKFPGKQSLWNGFECYDFTCNGRDAIIVSPKKAASGNPWIWRPAFFGAFPSVDIALLDKGFHIAYYDLTHLYGSPNAVQLGTDFYHIMCENYNLSKKVTLEGFSRGGLFAFNWAACNSDKVSCIYVDAPVCNILSWPGRKDSELWKGFLKEWNLEDNMVDIHFKGNAINTLTQLAKASIPIISVCGDSDKVVPYNDNMKPIYDTYKSMGGTIEVIIKEGCDHHPHSLEDPMPVVNFILQHQ